MFHPKRLTALLFASLLLFSGCGSQDAVDEDSFPTQGENTQSDSSQNQSDADTTAPEDTEQNSSEVNERDETSTPPNVDAETTQPDTTSPDTSTSCNPPADSQIGGLLFNDDERKAHTIYAYPPEQNRSPRDNVQLELTGSDTSQSTKSCSAGWFSFDSIDNGTYFVSVEEDESLFCTTTNDPDHLAETIQDDETIDFVTFGDSLPTEGAKPYFPSRVEDHIENLDADVELQNVAVGGTHSDDWVPDAELYNSKLDGKLSDADLVLFSIGGNDFSALREQLNPPFTSEKIAEATRLFNETKTEVINNIQKITEQLRQDAPNADLVWLLYPNYATSDQWEPFVGEYQSLVSNFLRNGLEDMRRTLSKEKRLIIVDTLEATASQDLSQYLIDELHFNEKGHRFVGKEIFYTLGGVIKEESSIGMHRKYGFAPMQGSSE